MTRAPAGPPWRQVLEKIGIGLFMAVVLTIGFYWIDFRNAAQEGNGATAWITEVWLDDHIPFVPIWIWPYLSYFPLCFAPLVFCAQHQRFRRIATAYMLTYGPSLVMFAVIPSRMIRPTFEVTDATTAALDWLYRIDPGYNIFPSLHVANAVLVAWIFQRYAPRWAPLFWLEAAAITASTVLVKQHYVVDLPAGVALGTLAFFVVFGGARLRAGDPDERAAHASARAPLPASAPPGELEAGRRT